MTSMTPPPVLRSSRSSIDLSLELEHQMARDEGDEPPPSSSSILDPQILADLIIQLRASIATITSERDSLVAELGAAHTREAELRDTLHIWTEKASTLEVELESARKKRQEDEDAITMLRSKVEESRRGVMRLQSENSRRLSGQFTDMASPRTPTFSVGGVPKSAKRNSFTPLTGSFIAGHGPSPSVASLPPSMHRANSSISDPGLELDSPAHDTHSLAIPDQYSARAASRRFTSMTARASPPRESLLNPLGAELDALRRELVAVRQELIDTRAELRESTEAREASETCVQALRAYIAESAAEAAISPTAHSSGGTLMLPPLPSDSTVNVVGDEKPKSGWGIKLWKKETPAFAPTDSARRDSTASALSSFWSSKSQPPSSTTSPVASESGQPLLKKLGDFWSSPQPPLPPTKEYPRPQPLSLSPPAGITPGLDYSSSVEEASEPTSPQPEDDAVQELIVHFDDTLADDDDDEDDGHALDNKVGAGDLTPRVVPPTHVVVVS